MRDFRFLLCLQLIPRARVDSLLSGRKYRFNLAVRSIAEPMPDAKKARISAGLCALWCLSAPADAGRQIIPTRSSTDRPDPRGKRIWLCSIWAFTVVFTVTRAGFLPTREMGQFAGRRLWQPYCQPSRRIPKTGNPCHTDADGSFIGSLDVGSMTWPQRIGLTS